MPRLAVDGYWRAHPIRADRLARALAARSGAPKGWTWQIGAKGVPASFRDPPAPYREPKFSIGPGSCCVCGQPVYRFGWHTDLWDAGPNRKAAWHTACVAAWRLWNAPSDYDQMLRKLQVRRCAQTGGRLWKTAEIDHCVPLFQVWAERRDEPWPVLLGYWGAPISGSSIARPTSPSAPTRRSIAGAAARQKTAADATEPSWARH